MFTESYNNLNTFNPAKSKLFSGSYVLAPKDPDKDKLGHLYLIVEFSLENSLARKITEIILEVLQKEYYRLDDFFREESILINFEKALNKTNQALSTLASEGYTDWIDNTHIAIAIIKNNKIHFANTGNPKIYLVRSNNFISINQESDSKSPSPMKTFTNITSGTLMADDNLFLATPELLNFIPEEKIKKLILNNKNEVIEYLKHEIPMVNDYSFAALSINIEKNDSASKFSPVVEEKDKPRELDFPSLNDLDSSNPNLAKEYSNTKTQATKNENKIPIFKRLNKLKSLSSSLINRNKISKDKDISPKRKQKFKSKSNYKNVAKNFPKVILHKFNKLPKSSKLLLILSVGLAVLFAGSLIILKQRKSEINKLSQHEILLNGALDKAEEANNALIYKDKDKAKELLLEARDEANRLIEADVMVTEANNLLAEISDQIDKVEGVTRIDDPLVIADLDDKNIDSIFGYADQIYSFDKSNNFIYNIDEENKQATTISDESNNLGYFTKGAMNQTNNSIILLTDSPSFAEFDLGTRSMDDQLEIDIFNYDEVTVDMKTYSDRLYRLIPTQQQIFKHTRTIAGYSKGVEWALSNTDELENAVSIAIDGFVYVLKADGNIIKYLRGIKQDYSLKEIQNPLESPTKIYTSDNLSNIYILEPDKNRVLAFNKNTGDLSIQYTSDKFRNLQDIYVDDDEQKLYILTQENILGIVLNSTGN